ncbi:SAM-dependent methyltransferase [Virgibacillus halotolerans]|uniref:class I SAM-dependent methyltransferase n=1 Tax=Virgibacillus halotolerans TaxID=1071053 RepID=UPI00195FDCEB|nr:methyltransferase domain-containing protein [Virgibacillus halotolerans]MBM7600915.1 SAM-dependent methyltransferase [Virgibacillus halotolerans]
MKEDAVTSIVNCMAIHENMNEIQRVQTAHRLKLIQFWGIEEGSRVLEIGCGQGDTTASLAYVVGEKGFVHGVDIASDNYGAPITLGDAGLYLQQSKIGNQIKIAFNIDILSPGVTFSPEAFDYIVLSHCSWYLKSFAELEAILSKVRKWGKKLCFAEWDTRIQSIEQYPHFLAVLIQSQYECFKESSLSNVRTLFTPADVRRIVDKVGWTVMGEETINSPLLQDGKWEVDMTLSDYKAEIDQLVHLPDKLASLIQSEIHLLEKACQNHAIKPMSTYVSIAE